MISLNGHRITPTIFPDKTSQVWKIPDDYFKIYEEQDIEWVFENESEFIHVAQLKMLIDSLFAKSAKLYIPYLPYARQDKKISNTQSFAIHTFASLLNSLSFNTVNCFDPHNYEVRKLIFNFRFITPEKEVQKIYDEGSYKLMVFPDHGALSRYAPVLYTKSYVYGTKTRDPKTGEITDYHLNECVKAKKVLIVDDICDGGATFVHLAKALKEFNVQEIGLYVSHGIFSKGLSVLTEAGIQDIYTREGKII